MAMNKSSREKLLLHLRAAIPNHLLKYGVVTTFIIVEVLLIKDGNVSRHQKLDC